MNAVSGTACQVNNRRRQGMTGKSRAIKGNILPATPPEHQELTTRENVRDIAKPEWRLLGIFFTAACGGIRGASA